LAAEVVQPLKALVASVLVQQVVALSEDIQEEVQPSTQVEDIEDEVGAIFEARGEAAEDKASEVDKAKLPELSAEEVARMGLPAVPTTASWRIRWLACFANFPLNSKNTKFSLIKRPCGSGCANHQN
jgi:hypothetical protein